MQLYKVYRRSVRESIIYDKLKTGPIFEDAIKHTIPRTALVEEIRQVTTPAEESRLYPVIIGEHGTGKTNLIKLAVDSMNKPKGIVYVDIPRKCDLEVDVAEVMQIALGWSPDEVINSSNRNYSSSLLMNIT
jgi:type II secretory pathway predicted ATPase ExeA